MSAYPSAGYSFTFLDQDLPLSAQVSEYYIELISAILSEELCGLFGTMGSAPPFLLHAAVFKLHPSCL